MNLSVLLWGVVFGSLGLGYYIYGKRQSAMLPLLCGIALMAIPYFVSSSLYLILVGGSLMAIPYYFRH